MITLFKNFLWTLNFFSLKIKNFLQWFFLEISIRCRSAKCLSNSKSSQSYSNFNRNILSQKSLLVKVKIKFSSDVFEKLFKKFLFKEIFWLKTNLGTFDAVGNVAQRSSILIKEYRKNLKFEQSHCFIVFLKNNRLFHHTKIKDKKLCF